MEIGIERSLTNVKSLLEQNNYNVVEMDNSNTDTKKAQKKFDAIIVSGLDSNFLGIQDTLSNTPVITANGKTAEEVYTELKNRLKRS